MVWEYYSFENKKTQTITQSIKENGIAGDCYGNQDTKQYNILWNRTRDSKQRDKKDCVFQMPVLLTLNIQECTLSWMVS